MTLQRLTLALLVVAVTATAASAQSFSCPSTSADSVFSGSGLQQDCSSCSSSPCTCTTKSGVNYDPIGSDLVIPGSAGNFQAPPSAAVPQNVFFAASGDFDGDGWDDFVAADDGDRIYVMRNQTITCGTASCSGTAAVAPTVQTIAATWWNTLANVRPAAFRATTTTAGADQPLKVSVSSNVSTPMVAADFDGDGWTDFIEISQTYRPGTPAWPTAARLFLNTQNCHLTSQVTNPQPCGIGHICTGQPANGACSGGSVTNGTKWTETQLSCTTTANCPYYMPTFATYDLRTGAVTSSAGTTSSTAPTTSFPGDFGPMGHAVQNVVALDWDGDGDIDILFGRSSGTCPGNLCTSGGQVFYAGIDVWKNDCAQSPQWNAATKSCPGHIPIFTHSATACTGTNCANSDVLIPSTAHNSTTIAPNTNLGFDIAQEEAPTFAYADVDRDGKLDLVLGSPGCCSNSANAGNRLRIFKGNGAGTNVACSSPPCSFNHSLDTANPLILSTSNSTHPGFEGSLTAIFVSDFNLDGYPDIITGSDGVAYSGTIGGRTRYWKNTGNASTPFGTNWPTCSTGPATCVGCSATCNNDPTQKLSESCGSGSCSANLGVSPPQFGDFDMGIMLDYDHDPQHTKDLVLTNGNTANEFYIFPNRASPSTIAACGTVASGTLATPSAELTVNGACIAPTATVPSGTAINYFLSNDGGTSWSLDCTQQSTGFTPPLSSGKCCVTFSNITNRQIEWKAEFDSNTSDGIGAPSGCGAVGTASPSLTGLSADYSYTQATQHYKAGVIVSDGVSYVGSFTQPGNRGHMYAIAENFSTQYYDVGAQLDAQATRYVYTSDITGQSPTRLTFSASSPPAALEARVGASTQAQASTVINWVLSARFGVNTTGAALTKLGAIVDSTPAILQVPFKPNWYAFLDTADRTLYDTFATTQAQRIPLLLFGSMDGMVHAIYTIATSISDARNGSEAWAYVPPYDASPMTSDYTTSCTPSCAAGTLTVSSYPDGSPGLVDFRKANGTIATAGIFADGAGGTSVSALDLTQTVTATSTTANTVQGPTPLWSAQPGGAAAGNAISKPGIARVLLGGTETYVAIAGTGVNNTDNTKGKIVGGYNLETGALLWQFEMACALTSDITVFETDDSGELGNPQLDGFADRAVFADQCGNVYKINPGQNLAGGYMDNTGYGSISIGVSNGKTRYALFSTATSAGAIGGQRPIANTIGARPDSSLNVVLFFGTGGIETFNPALQNEFYAVYAKNGVIRNKVTGTCSGGECQKYYGGVVVTPTNIYMVTSSDPVISSGTCNLGSSSLNAFDLNTLASTFSVSQINGQAISSSAGPLYGADGALYFATVAGNVERVGTPTAATAGAASAAGTLNGMGSATVSDANGPFTLVGWRVVL